LGTPQKRKAPLFRGRQERKGARAGTGGVFFGDEHVLKRVRFLRPFLPEKRREMRQRKHGRAVAGGKKKNASGPAVPCERKGKEKEKRLADPPGR